MNSIDRERKDVIRQILEMERQGQNLCQDSVSKENKVLFQKASDLFGSWMVALKYAGVGIQQKQIPKSVENTVINQLRAHIGRLHSTKAHKVQKFNHTLYRSALITFGSWKNALKAARFNSSRRVHSPTNPKLTDEEILALLQKSYQEGKSVRKIDWACDNFALTRTICTRFKSWKAALLQAGIELKKHSDEQRSTDPAIEEASRKPT